MGISPTDGLRPPPPSTEGGERERGSRGEAGRMLYPAAAVRTGPRGCKEIPRLRLGMTEYCGSWRARGVRKRAAQERLRGR